MAMVKDTAQVDPRATVGDGTVNWELAQARESAVLGAECIIGPAVVLTNDEFPRAVYPDGSPKSGDWTSVGVTVGEGASIGARGLRRVDWVGRAEVPLPDNGDGTWSCERSTVVYVLEDEMRIQL